MRVQIRMLADIPDNEEDKIPDAIDGISQVVKHIFNIAVGMNSPIVVSIERMSESEMQEGKIL